MSGRSENQARMEQLVRRWRASVLSLSAFARQERISRDKLQYWRDRLTQPSSRSRGSLEPAGLTCDGSWAICATTVLKHWQRCKAGLATTQSDSTLESSVPDPPRRERGRGR